MKKIKLILKFIINLIIIFLIAYWVSHTINESKREVITITLEKEPDYISTTNGEELLVVIDGKIVSYDSVGNTKTIQLDMQIAKVYHCSDWLWIIDDEANLYTLQVKDDNTYEMSDVILENVKCVEGNADKAMAITMDGEVYVWGRDDEYYSLGLGEIVEVKEPTKVEGIKDAKEVVFFNVNTAILTETGELYVAGGISSSEWSEEKQESITNTEYVKEFEKVKHDSTIAHIGEYEGFYTIYQDGTVLEWSGIEINDDGYVVLEPGFSDWDSDLQFTQISFGASFAIGMDAKENIYFWGFDFTRKMKSKADYVIYNNPKLIEFDKDVESVYAIGDAAFLKNGLEIYSISNR